MNTSTGKVVLGVVGAGPWGRNILRALGRAAQNVVVDALWTRSSEPRAEDLGVNWNDLVHDEDAFWERSSHWDGLVIASPASHHGSWVEQAVARGLGVFVEKPLALSLLETQRLVSLLDRSRKESGISKKPRPFLVNHIHLFNPVLRALVSRWGADIVAFESWGGNWGPFRQDCGPLWDYGPHEFSVLAALFQMTMLGTGLPMVEFRSVDSEVIGEGTVFRVSGSIPGRLQQFQLTFGNGFKTKQRTLRVRLRDGRVILWDDLLPREKALYGEGNVSLGDFSLEGSLQSARAPLDQSLAEFVSSLRASAVGASAGISGGSKGEMAASHGLSALAFDPRFSLWVAQHLSEVERRAERYFSESR